MITNTLLIGIGLIIEHFTGVFGKLLEITLSKLKTKK
jgi:hypothetical protein